MDAFTPFLNAVLIVTVMVGVLVVLQDLQQDGRFHWIDRHPFLTALAIVATVPLGIDLVLRVFSLPGGMPATWIRVTVDLAPAALLSLVLLDGEGIIDGARRYRE